MELGGRGDEVGSEPDGEGHCKEIRTPFASTGGVGGGVSAFKESMATFLFHSGNVSLWSGRGR